MRYAGIARVVVFYLLAVILVFYISDIGPIESYLIFILLSILFCLMAGVRLRLGDPLPGSVISALAITAIFTLMLAAGSIAITGTGSNIRSILLSGIVLQVFVACGEEMAFRGYIFGDLRNTAGVPAAIVLSSIGFAFLHIRSMLDLGVSPVSLAIGMATITSAGALLAILTVHAGLLSAIGFHFIWNFLQYHVFGLGLHGEFPALVNLAQAGNPLITGGHFGPEASLPGLAVILITLGAMWYYYRRKNTDSKFINH